MQLADFLCRFSSCAAFVQSHLNGNLISDGTNTYTWNARDGLVAISGPGINASFQYDVFGRRITRTVNGQAKTYLYAGENVVQEQSGGTATANLLSGGIDELFLRSDSSGALSPLSDALGSPIALADSSGTLQTQYTYDPFGNTSSTGAASPNPSQFTGRENDGTGLYYYRGRYYSPLLQRFISQDPIGTGGGLNLYAYASDNPVTFTDPFGLEKNSPFISEAQFCHALGVIGTYCAGFGDYISGGLTDSARDITGANDAVDKTHGSYFAGQVSACVWEVSFAAAGAAAAARAAAAEAAGTEAAVDGATAGRSPCFAAGTKVLTDRGEKVIEDIAVGDTVMSTDPILGKTTAQAVTNVFARTSPLLLDISVGETVITCTPEHPFWVSGVGWQQAGSLSIGSNLETRTGARARIEAIERREGFYTVYNLEVRGVHSYRVSDLGILVHNQCGKPPLSSYKKALGKVHDEVGRLPKGEPGKFGSPQRGCPKKGYRLDPPHPDAPPGSPETGHHINWWDYTGGKRRGGGGRKGVVPIL